MYDYLNVKDYGAVGNNINDDGPAIQTLIDDISLKSGKAVIYLPEGQYRITQPLVIKPNIALVGQSSKVSIIEAHESDALVFQIGFLNARVEHLRLQGAGPAECHTAVRLSGSQMNRLDWIEIWDFKCGIELSDGVTSFSGYNNISRFQVTGCKKGVVAYKLANCCTLRDGRVLGMNGGDIGIDVKDVEALSIIGVTSEGSDLPLKVRGVVECSVIGSYFEAFGGKPAFDIELSNNAANRSVMVFTGNHCSAPGLLVVPPEAFFENDTPALPAHVPARHPAATPGRNYVRNGDLRMWQPPPSFNIPNWFLVGAVSEETTDFVTSGRSMRIQGANQAAVSFEVPDSCEWVTVGVRYKIVSSPPAPKFEVVSGTNSLLVDPPPGPVGVWREDFFSIRSIPGAEGALRIIANGGEVLVDEVWAVAGRVAAASRAYAERVEMLQHPRPLVERTGVTAGEFWAAGPLVGFLQPPLGAVGAVLRMSVLCMQPVTVPHHLSLGTPSSGSPPPPRCYPVFAGVQATQDVTVRLAPNLAMGGEYWTGDATPVDYSVWLLGWVVI